MQIKAIAVMVWVAATPAAADVFASLSGTFGVPDLPDETCATNPVFSTFSPDRTRVTFTWNDPVLSYTGQMITSYGGSVVRAGPDSVTLQRDRETRLDYKGVKVLWIMRLTTNPEGYCWTQSDWSPQDCAPMLRCGPQPNS